MLIGEILLQNGHRGSLAVNDCTISTSRHRYTWEKCTYARREEKYTIMLFWLLLLYKFIMFLLVFIQKKETYLFLKT